MSMTEPLEYDEEIALSDYLDSRFFLHWHVPQETFTKSWGTKMKNRRMGVRKGVSDHWVVIPMPNGKQQLVAIELKRQHSGTPSDEQIAFIEAMLDADVYAFVAHGANEAINILDELEQGKDTKFWENTEKMRKIAQKRAEKRANENKCPF